MKIIDIAIKDLRRSFRSSSALIFMFGLPLMVTGMFYLMFGNIARGGEFSLPATRVIVSNMDAGGPKFQVNPKNIPGGRQADTMGDLVVSILQSDEMVDLIEVTFASDPMSARAAVDRQDAQVALIIPADFSQQFAGLDGKASIEFYQDPTLTLGPAIMRSILNRFMDGMSGVKIAVNTFMDEASPEDYHLAGQVVDQYLQVSLATSEDLEGDLLDVRKLSRTEQDQQAEEQNMLLRIISPIMGGMMVFYAFFTGASSAQSILREEEEHTLPRLFTTPTSQTAILTGKLLSVFSMVGVQVIVLLVAARLIFGIRWGDPRPLVLTAVGVIFIASSFGIFINSFFKTTKQAGVLFGGVLTVTGMLGMIPIFARGSPSADRLANGVSLLVPQGWAIRSLTQTLDGLPVNSVFVTLLVMLAWSAAFFVIGVMRFKRRYF